MTHRLNSWWLAVLGVTTFAVTAWIHRPRPHEPLVPSAVAERTTARAAYPAAPGLSPEPTSADSSAANPNSPEPAAFAGVAADESDMGFVLAARPLPPATGAGPPDDTQALPDEDPTVDDLPGREPPAL